MLQQYTFESKRHVSYLLEEEILSSCKVPPCLCIYAKLIERKAVHEVTESSDEVDSRGNDPLGQLTQVFIHTTYSRVQDDVRQC